MKRDIESRTKEWFSTIKNKIAEGEGTVDAPFELLDKKYMLAFCIHEVGTVNIKLIIDYKQCKYLRILTSRVMKYLLNETREYIISFIEHHLLQLIAEALYIVEKSVSKGLSNGVDSYIINLKDEEIIYHKSSVRTYPKAYCNDSFYSLFLVRSSTAKNSYFTNENIEVKTNDIIIGKKFTALNYKKYRVIKNYKDDLFIRSGILICEISKLPTPTNLIFVEVGTDEIKRRLYKKSIDSYKRKFIIK